MAAKRPAALGAATGRGRTRAIRPIPSSREGSPGYIPTLIGPELPLGAVASRAKVRMMRGMEDGRGPFRAAENATATRCAPVLGIDPGLERTGYAVLVPADGLREARVCEAGLVRLMRRAPLEERLSHLQESLEALIQNHHPSVLVCEELYSHYRHPRTAVLMAHARGVVFAAAARCGLRVLAVSATQAKKTLTGSGRASKPQVQRAVAATLRMPRLPEPHDVADAIAIALCGLRIRQAARRDLREVRA